MDKYELVERYEALGDEDDFLAAQRLFERDLTGSPSALDHRQYGYLLECHGRRALRQAVDHYEQAIAANPGDDKTQYQWMHAEAALGEPDDAVTRYRTRAAGSPGEVPELRFLASACLLARDYAAASDVIGAGLALASGDAKLTSDHGDLRAVRGDAEGALADWRRAHELDPEELRPGVLQRLPARAPGQAGRGHRGVALHPGPCRHPRLGPDRGLAPAGNPASAGAARRPPAPGG